MRVEVDRELCWTQTCVPLPTCWHKISDCIAKLILQHNEDFLSGYINVLLLHNKLPQTQQLKQRRFLSHSFHGQQSGFDLAGSFAHGVTRLQSRCCPF